MMLAENGRVKENSILWCPLFDRLFTSVDIAMVVNDVSGFGSLFPGKFIN